MRRRRLLAHHRGPDEAEVVELVLLQRHVVARCSHDVGHVVGRGLVAGLPRIAGRVAVGARVGVRDLLELDHVGPEVVLGDAVDELLRGVVDPVGTCRRVGVGGRSCGISARSDRWQGPGRRHCSRSGHREPPSSTSSVSWAHRDAPFLTAKPAGVVVDEPSDATAVNTRRTRCEPRRRMWTLATRTTNGESHIVVKLGRCWRRWATVGSVIHVLMRRQRWLSMIVDVDRLHKTAPGRLPECAGRGVPQPAVGCWKLHVRVVRRVNHQKCRHNVVTVETGDVSWPVRGDRGVVEGVFALEGANSLATAATAMLAAGGVRRGVRTEARPDDSARMSCGHGGGQAV